MTSTVSPPTRTTSSLFLETYITVIRITIYPVSATISSNTTSTIATTTANIPLLIGLPIFLVILFLAGLGCFSQHLHRRQHRKETRMNATLDAAKAWWFPMERRAMQRFWEGEVDAGRVVWALWQNSPRGLRHTETTEGVLAGRDSIRESELRVLEGESASARTGRIAKEGATNSLRLLTENEQASGETGGVGLVASMPLPGTMSVALSGSPPEQAMVTPPTLGSSSEGSPPTTTIEKHWLEYSALMSSEVSTMGIDANGSGSVEDADETNSDLQHLIFRSSRLLNNLSGYSDMSTPKASSTNLAKSLVTTATGDGISDSGDYGYNRDYDDIVNHILADNEQDARYEDEYVPAGYNDISDGSIGADTVDTDHDTMFTARSRVASHLFDGNAEPENRDSILSRIRDSQVMNIYKKDPSTASGQESSIGPPVLTDTTLSEGRSKSENVKGNDGLSESPVSVISEEKILAIVNGGLSGGNHGELARGNRT